MRRYAAFLGARHRHCVPACDWSVGAAPAGLCPFLPIQLRRSAGIIRQPCLSSRQCQPQAFARDKTGRYCRRTVGARTGRRPGGPRARPRSERSRARRHRTQALVRLSGGGGRRQTDQLRDGLPGLRGAYGQTSPVAEGSLCADGCAADRRRARLDGRNRAAGDRTRLRSRLLGSVAAPAWAKLFTRVLEPSKSAMLPSGMLAAASSRRQGTNDILCLVHGGFGARQQRARLADDVASQPVRRTCRLRRLAAGQPGRKIAGVKTVANGARIDRH